MATPGHPADVGSIVLYCSCRASTLSWHQRDRFCWHRTLWANKVAFIRLKGPPRLLNTTSHHAQVSSASPGHHLLLPPPPSLSLLQRLRHLHGTLLMRSRKLRGARDSRFWRHRTALPAIRILAVKVVKMFVEAALTSLASMLSLVMASTTPQMTMMKTAAKRTMGQSPTTAAVRVVRANCGELHAQFPEVFDKDPSANCDTANLQAAQCWECTCSDRYSCSSPGPISVFELHYHRKKFRTEGKTAGKRGGYRDAFRLILDQHHSKEICTFSCSFVIGKTNDCCVAAAGLAAGLSFRTYANVRADCIAGRPFHAGRKVHKDKLESEARRQIYAYILSVRNTMEGDKGGSS
eukprot:272721-Pleurochrysis_carterae.AAC.3